MERTLQGYRNRPIRTDGLQPHVLEAFNLFSEQFPNVRAISGFRDPTHNARVGGASASRHIRGDALDFDVTGMSPDQQLAVLNFFRDRGAQGFGHYGNSIHVDWGSPRAWGPNRRSSSIPQTPDFFQQFVSGGAPTQAAAVAARAAPAAARAAPASYASNSPAPQGGSVLQQLYSAVTEPQDLSGIDANDYAGGDWIPPDIGRELARRQMGGGAAPAGMPQRLDGNAPVAAASAPPEMGRGVGINAREPFPNAGPLEILRHRNAHPGMQLRSGANPGIPPREGLGGPAAFLQMTPLQSATGGAPASALEQAGIQPRVPDSLLGMFEILRPSGANPGMQLRSGANPGIPPREGLGGPAAFSQMANPRAVIPSEDPMGQEGGGVRVPNFPGRPIEDPLAISPPAGVPQAAVEQLGSELISELMQMFAGMGGMGGTGGGGQQQMAQPQGPDAASWLAQLFAEQQPMQQAQRGPSVADVAQMLQGRERELMGGVQRPQLPPGLMQMFG